MQMTHAFLFAAFLLFPIIFCIIFARFAAMTSSCALPFVTAVTLVFTVSSTGASIVVEFCFCGGGEPVGITPEKQWHPRTWTRDCKTDQQNSHPTLNQNIILSNINNSPFLFFLLLVSGLDLFSIIDPTVFCDFEDWSKLRIILIKIEKYALIETFHNYAAA